MLVRIVLAAICAASRSAHITGMKKRLRYLSAVCVNLLLPWLAFRLAAPHGGYAAGLLASTLPLLAWMIWDYARYRHFDALSALVLAGIVMSLIAHEISSGPGKRVLEQPVVSGMVGASFLASLLFRRPMVYYLGRSTMARESPARAAEFEQNWKTRPKLVAALRMMTLVWGLFMTSENLVRCVIVWSHPGDPQAAHASALLGYIVYGGLTVWTFWYRRQRLQKDPETASAAIAE
ncbi:VC0807 family protein [Paraburkholderia saeva]|uniref:DUF3159 domain-containing protein n=1 Tax=Paraburkholderia saeva TaxID=2777537 RepID=A0A9N8X0G7_9BURK|nr:VC0807 family protein [Paraburkholderia saeva]CAG4890992.1 hypothetical protein LMG31841_01278 [Paraburkholderia saeva]CAG4894278.1 hypothetical protein R52603_01763 [Paraburkholderia saeva]CAG4924089.1 hypothetical protein R70241_05228 [Paraburkholderia saeva]